MEFWTPPEAPWSERGWSRPRLRRTRSSERQRRNVEIRVEIFNLTNTTPFAAPNTVFGNPAFGTSTSAGDPRVVQLGLKLHF